MKMLEAVTSKYCAKLKRRVTKPTALSKGSSTAFFSLLVHWLQPITAMSMKGMPSWALSLMCHARAAWMSTLTPWELEKREKKQNQKTPREFEMLWPLIFLYNVALPSTTSTPFRMKKGPRKKKNPSWEFALSGWVLDGADDISAMPSIAGMRVFCVCRDYRS